MAGRLLDPRDPETAARRQAVAQEGELPAEIGAVAGEEVDVVEQLSGVGQVLSLGDGSRSFG